MKNYFEGYKVIIHFITEQELKEKHNHQGDSRSNMTGTRADNQNHGYAVGLTSSWYQHGNQKQGAWLDSWLPVSYTHLDVYKRQAFTVLRQVVSEVDHTNTQRTTTHRSTFGGRDRVILIIQQLSLIHI